MEQAGQEVPTFMEFASLFHVHKIPPLDPILSQMKTPLKAVIKTCIFGLCFRFTVPFRCEV